MKLCKKARCFREHFDPVETALSHQNIHLQKFHPNLAGLDIESCAQTYSCFCTSAESTFHQQVLHLIFPCSQGTDF